MKASALEFRLRYLIHVVIYTLGFTTPWNYWLHLDTVRTWQWLAAWLSRSKWMDFSASTITVLVAGIVFAVIAALLRTWGAAYLGSSVVQDPSMHGGEVIAAGPYRYVRNPLYLGTIFNTLALALLMLPSGAVLSIVLIVLVQWRLIGGEEAFLSAKRGEAYTAYCAKVPRIVPSLRPRIPASPGRPRWGGAVLGEIYVLGTAVSFIVLGWRYNSILIVQGILVSLGVSLIARAFISRPHNEAENPGNKP